MLGVMKQMRRCFFALCVALAALAGVPAGAAGPARNLEVELRWVDSSVSGVALAGVRDGATVIGTAGSVSPTPMITLSTQHPADANDQAQRIIVLNGKSASVTMSEQMPVQWLDYAVQMQGAAGGQAPDLSKARISAAPRTSFVERTRGFVVTPQWPGGKQPVQVELKAMTPQDGGQQQVFSTVQVALGDWITVARSGGPLHAPEPGVIRSSDAEPQVSRELQLRVNVAP